MYILLHIYIYIFIIILYIYKWIYVVAHVFIYTIYRYWKLICRIWIPCSVLHLQSSYNPTGLYGYPPMILLISISTYLPTSLPTYLPTYLSLCICISIYTYIYIYTYIHIHVCIHTHAGISENWGAPRHNVLTIAHMACPMSKKREVIWANKNEIEPTMQEILEYIYEIFNPKGDLLCPELGTPQFLIINHEI